MTMTVTPETQPAPDVRRSRSLRTLTTWIVGVGILLWSLHGIDVDLTVLAEGQRGARLLISGLLSPDVSREWLAVCLAATIETVQIAIVGLAIAAALAAPLGVMLAGNVEAPGAVRELSRAVAALLRGVPDLLWALLLVAALGPGPAAGALAIGLHGGGALAKLWAEQLESVDPNPVEAMRMMGAGRGATSVLAIIPLARGGIVSLLLFQAECNIRSSTVLGFVGAGGIGQELAINLKLFRYEQLSTLVLAVLALMLITDLLSRVWRRRLGAQI